VLIKCSADFIHAIEQDPVRPLNFIGGPLRRFEEPFEVYALIDKQGFGVVTHAVVCVAYTWFVPETEEDLLEAAKDPQRGDIVVPYSLWSNQKGAGRKLINSLLHALKGQHRVVTMSPKTEQAARFHLGNGARLLQENEFSNNFEYDTGVADGKDNY